jgi:hypothetical protein
MVEKQTTSLKRERLKKYLQLFRGKELKVKAPFNAVEKSHKLDPLIFKGKPIKFKNKILNLEKTE